jgi:hypothetical protein
MRASLRRGSRLFLGVVVALEETLELRVDERKNLLRVAPHLFKRRDSSRLLFAAPRFSRPTLGRLAL